MRPFDRILAEYGVEIVPTSSRRSEGQTHAGGVLRQILWDHGSEHLCLVLALLRGSARNREALFGETIASLSGVLAQRRDWYERFDEVAEALEAIDLDALRGRAVRLRPWPVRGMLRAFLYLLLERQIDRPTWKHAA